MRLIFSILFVSIAYTVLIFSVHDVLAQDEEDTEPIQVVTKDIEPFVFVAEKDVSGFSIDLWEALAQEIGIEYEYQIVETVQEQLEAVANNEADLAIAAITITEERENSVDFSHKYFISGLGILTNINQEHSLRDALFAAVSPTILRLLVGLFLTIVIAGHIIWLIERRRNPEFPRAYLQGVWEGIWWSAVTVTSVGYGDKVPIHKLGRIVAIMWMLVSLILVANFTANVTSELTFQRLQGVIEGPEDLFGKRVTTVTGTTADEWLTDRGIRHSTVESIDDAYALLDAKEVQAIVYDYPVLLYRISQYPHRNYTIPGGPFYNEEYGIAFPEGSLLREDINRALLRLSENGSYDQIFAKWYGGVFD